MEVRWARLGLWASGAVVGAVLVVGVVAPFVAYDPASAVDYEQQLMGPSGAHWLGTDGQGRDIAMRLLKGTEAFFLPGMMAAAVATLFGALAGSVREQQDLIAPVGEAWVADARTRCCWRRMRWHGWS